MFKLLGADRKEYGPVSADQIREWIAQGRANAQTKLQAAGSADWKPLAEFPEFADALRQATPPGTLSPLPATGIPTAAAPPKTSGMAVTSLVLGILGVLTCGLTALAGLVLGFMAISRIKNSNGQLEGRGIAVAGTIVSTVFLLMIPLPVAMLLPALGKAKQKASAIQCMNNVKQLNLGLIMYADDNKEKFPSGATWCDDLKPYLGNSTKPYVCPLGAPNQRCHYAFNSGLVGVSVKDIRQPAQTVLVFETDGGWNLSGGRELLPAKGRHSGAYAVGFADGHAEIVRPDRLAKLRWEP
jgi:prepilin-type processing-associated H-X9-DG protein